MDIKPVYNNQVVFQGTVDKSLVKYINRAVTNECQTILDNANKSGVMVDEKALKGCKQYAVDIGESPHFISRVSHWINKASEAKQNAKDIKARNNKIVNDILNS
jgi:hypothetical protein